MSTINTGKDAEAHACCYLQAQGLQLVQRNYHSRRGEIDLIMQDKDSLVFIEVRYRRQSRFGSAAESVNHHKQSKLIACANHYIQTYPERARQACRFDVVSIDGNMDSIDWIKNAFDARN